MMIKKRKMTDINGEGTLDPNVMSNTKSSENDTTEIKLYGEILNSPIKKFDICSPNKNKSKSTLLTCDNISDKFEFSIGVSDYDDYNIKVQKEENNNFNKHKKNFNHKNYQHYHEKLLNLVARIKNIIAEYLNTKVYPWFKKRFRKIKEGINKCFGKIAIFTKGKKISSMTAKSVKSQNLKIYIYLPWINNPETLTSQIAEKITINDIQTNETTGELGRNINHILISVKKQKTITTPINFIVNLHASTSQQHTNTCECKKIYEQKLIGNNYKVERTKETIMIDESDISGELAVLVKENEQNFSADNKYNICPFERSKKRLNYTNGDNYYWYDSSEGS